MMDGLAQQPDLSVVGGFGSASALDELARAGPDRRRTGRFHHRPGRTRAILQAAVRTPACTWSAAPAACPLEHSTRSTRRCTQPARAACGPPTSPSAARLMMYFARVAARFMDAAEVIELHHDEKVDAPSGTAIQTARDIRAGARQRPARPAGRALDPRRLTRRRRRRRAHPQRAPARLQRPPGSAVRRARTDSEHSPRRARPRRLPARRRAGRARGPETRGSGARPGYTHGSQ